MGCSSDMLNEVDGEVAEDFGLCLVRKLRIVITDPSPALF